MSWERLKKKSKNSDSVTSDSSDSLRKLVNDFRSDPKWKIEHYAEVCLSSVLHTFPYTYVRDNPDTNIAKESFDGGTLLDGGAFL